MNNLLKISVSKTKTFLNCKAQFNYNYNLHLQKKVWAHHTLGKFAHKALEDFHNYYIEGSKDKHNIVMAKSFKNALNEYKADVTPDIKKECYDMMNTYLKLIANSENYYNPGNVLACEKSFSIMLNENLKLSGAIDRIQVDPDGILHVGDYKTVKNKKYLENDFFQLLTYAYICLAEDASIQKVRASYILLRHNFEYITEEFSRDEILTIPGKYIKYAEDILNEKDFNPNPSALCEYCDYLSHCESGLKQISAKSAYGEMNW